MSKKEATQASFGGEFSLPEAERQALHKLFPLYEQREQALELMLQGKTAQQARNILSQQEQDDVSSAYRRKK